MDIIRQWFESYAPAIIIESRSGYLNQGYKENIEQVYANANWYLRGHEEVMKWFIFISFSFIHLKEHKIMKLDKQLFNLYNFSLLFYGIVNVFGGVPSMGRFYAVGYMLCLAFLFLYILKMKRSYGDLINSLVLPALAIFIIVRLRMALGFMGASLLFGNPLTASLIDYESPLIEFIKGLL
jgi:hypothetical protein